MRKPKSLFSKGDFKANEYRCLLLYYFRFALSGLLDMKYVKHFQLFSSSIYNLLKASISHEEIREAEIKLNQFADSFEELYCRNNVTMNLHLLRHMPMAVRYLGPLWAQSAYGFEANNGVVTRSNTACSEIVHQLAWKYVMKCYNQTNGSVIT